MEYVKRTTRCVAEIVGRKRKREEAACTGRREAGDGGREVEYEEDANIDG